MYEDYRSKYKEIIENNITLPYQLEEYKKIQRSKNISKVASAINNMSKLTRTTVSK